MKFSLEIWSSDYNRVLATCQRAEQLGFDGFYYGESPNELNQECWTTLAALAQATSIIRLGPVITNVLPTFRSSLLLARQAQAVATISNGRLDLRTGVGADSSFGRAWWETTGVRYPPYATRLDDLVDALDLIDNLIEPAVPVTMAATGERAMRVAAARATTWETSFCTPAEFAERRSRFDELAAAQHRQVQHSLEIDGFVATTSDRLDALLARVGRERGQSEDLKPILARALVGTPKTVAKQLTDLSTAGVDQVVVAIHDPLDVDALESLAAAAEQAQPSVDA